MPNAAPHRTWMAKPGDVPRRWWLVDAKDQVLGRFASRIARVLMGKHKPTYTPHIDTGDFVVVVNAAGVRLTGRKAEQMTYVTHSRYPGGQRTWLYRDVHARHPDRVVRLAVQRMMPKSKLGRHMLAKLKVYAGTQHEHAAQQPAPLAF
jgi:large subunit ribosomal protein L13